MSCRHFQLGGSGQSTGVRFPVAETFPISSKFLSGGSDNTADIDPAAPRHCPADFGATRRRTPRFARVYMLPLVGWCSLTALPALGQSGKWTPTRSTSRPAETAFCAPFPSSKRLRGRQSEHSVSRTTGLGRVGAVAR